MELRHLRYFVAVGDLLNFRKAAESLSISRPALSKQIKDLETEIGVRLLERDTVSVSLTKAGEVFLDDARELLERSQKAIDRATQAQAGRLGKLRIASVGVIATDFLPSTLQNFHKRFPDADVAFVEMQPQEQLDALDRGTIDVGFAYGSDPVTQADKELLRVIRSQFGIALSRHHPLASQEGISLADIKHETLLCFGNGPRTHREEVQRFISEQGYPIPKIRSLDGFDGLVTLVAANQGISMFPHVLDLTSQGIVNRPILANSPFEFQMWAVWNRDSQSQLVRHFIDLLKKSV